MTVIRSAKREASSTVRSVDPSLTTVIATSVTGEPPMIELRTARQRSMTPTIDDSSLRAGMAISSFMVRGPAAGAEPDRLLPQRRERFRRATFRDAHD